MNQVSLYQIKHKATLNNYFYHWYLYSFYFYNIRMHHNIRILIYHLSSWLFETRLEEFLLNENNIHKIWKELTPFEREYIEEFLRYDELPSYEKVEYLHEKYGIKKERFKKPWEIESKIKLIFQLEAVPYPIKKILEKYLP
ncbi:hypothetical protein [Clostridium sp. BL-8]|uniref:hypothetical protein n=1 Tax=Clostridium sp. BL-8 TaxID=349938 RepID=UPI0009C6B550|nr:hypothetical protein [Clostridium sp. BL-8]OOM78842.1 hypothetical protein CLOBL_20900 [Clostridium sp. BL-8]